MAYVVRRADKLAALGRILDLEDGAATLVFARTRGEVDDLAEALSGRGRDAAALHGGLSQEQRDQIMGRFREGALDVLVATDVAARGLDIEHITHVVNYDVPSSPDTYVHRIGRTGRAGREGVAITLVEPREHRLLRDIERTIKQPLEIAGLPTVSDMREHRLDMLRGSLREALVAGGTRPLPGRRGGALGRVRPRGHRARGDQPGRRRARGAEDTTELAPATLPSFDRPARPADPRRAGRVRATASRPAATPSGRIRSVRRVLQARRLPRSSAVTGSPGRSGRAVQQGRAPGHPAGAGPASGPMPAGPRKGYRASGWRDIEGRAVMRPPHVGSGGGGITRVFVGAGRAAGMRPGDLVGAITNEAGLRGGDIGAIQIADGFSLVEVPEGAADHVIRTLREATIRGQKVIVRRERY